MKRIFTALIISSLLSITIWANGVVVVNSETSQYLKLLSSEIIVNVENQVAVISSKQTFKNTYDDSTKMKYAFPMPVGASSTKLSWFTNNKWETAVISAEPQDTTLPGGTGGSSNNTLKEYLGDLPLYFEIKNKLAKDSLITFVLEYVQLLNYEFGDVIFSYPNDYSLIQSEQIDLAKIEFNLSSKRTIEDLRLISHNTNL